MRLSVQSSRAASPPAWDEAWKACDHATYFHSREWAEIWDCCSERRPRRCGKFQDQVRCTAAELPRGCAARCLHNGEILYQEAGSTDGVTTAEELDRRIATAGPVTLRHWLEHPNSQVPFETARLDAATVYRERPDYLSSDQGA